MKQKNILIIGAGGVGLALARKCAQHNDAFGDITVASRRQVMAESVADSARAYRQNSSHTITAAAVDAKDSAAVAALIKKTSAAAVLNVASPHTNMGVIEGCLQGGAHYLDTAVYETENTDNAPPPPWYEQHEWQKRTDFAARGITGVLSIGFDPGVVNVFCAYAAQELFDTIDSIDIMDINAGQHGHFFATNFDPETNLREIREDVIYWHDGWRREPCHSKSMRYDFPVGGQQRVFSMGHEELHSLPYHIKARRIEFWMGFSDRYLRVFGVLHKLGLLASAPLDVEGTPVSPIKLIKAVLPPPQSLAAQYTGNICIGCLVRGEKNGQPRAVFIYSPLAHEAARADIGTQAISYSTAIPLATAALLVLNGEWQTGQLMNAEQFAPEPFLSLMPKLGMPWQVKEEAPQLDLTIIKHDDTNPPVDI